MQLWQECLSDEDDNEPFEDSDDKFVPGNSSDSSDNEHTRKKCR